MNFKYCHYYDLKNDIQFDSDYNIILLLATIYLY
jgi:hypothetical protein